MSRFAEHWQLYLAVGAFCFFAFFIVVLLVAGIIARRNRSQRDWQDRD
ncbi:MAG TPA: hypothetical protein VKE94_00795 [Gemmataceae bacterium]|nr:hypothetical protein [Gemmataceae bacterium]